MFMHFIRVCVCNHTQTPHTQYITISYSNPGAIYTERQTLLRRSFIFRLFLFLLSFETVISKSKTPPFLRTHTFFRLISIEIATCDI